MERKKPPKYLPKLGTEMQNPPSISAKTNPEEKHRAREQISRRRTSESGTGFANTDGSNSRTVAPRGTSGSVPLSEATRPPRDPLKSTDSANLANTAEGAPSKLRFRIHQPKTSSNTRLDRPKLRSQTTSDVVPDYNLPYQENQEGSGLTLVSRPIQNDKLPFHQPGSLTRNQTTNSKNPESLILTDVTKDFESRGDPTTRSYHDTLAQKSGKASSIGQVKPIEDSSSQPHLFRKRRIYIPQTDGNNHGQSEDRDTRILDRNALTRYRGASQLPTTTHNLVKAAKNISRGSSVSHEPTKPADSMAAINMMLQLCADSGHLKQSLLSPYQLAIGSYKTIKSQIMKQKLPTDALSVLNYDFLCKLNLSNNLLIDPISSKSIQDEGSRDLTNPGASKFYKYFLNKYNNADLVKRVISRRSWWVPVKDHSDPRVNLVWTQFPISEVLQRMPVSGWMKSTSSSSRDIDRTFSLQVQEFIQNTDSNSQQGSKFSRQYLNLHLKVLPLDTTAFLMTRHLHPGPSKHLPWETTSSQQRNQILQKYSGSLSIPPVLQIRTAKSSLCMNKLEDNWQYGHKSYMFLNLQTYCDKTGIQIGDIVPQTFYLSPEGEENLTNCEGYLKFKKTQTSSDEGSQDVSSSQDVWLLKPAENTFGGMGIRVFKQIDELQDQLAQIDKQPPTISGKKYVVQKYIHNPLLIHGRKFDVRSFMLLTSFNGKFKSYWYPEGYIRTSSEQFDLDDCTNLAAHLTNDCFQKNTEEYGKYEKGNKIMFHEFFSYLASTLESEEWQCTTASCNCRATPTDDTAESVHIDSPNLPWTFWLDTMTQQPNSSEWEALSKPSIKNIYRHLMCQMVQIARHLTLACLRKVDPRRRMFSFELVGLDFMIDDTYKVWLIEANNSPSLVVSENQALNNFFQDLIENVFILAVDPIFPPPRHAVHSQMSAAANRFTLILSD